MFKASENATEGTGLSFLDVPYLGPCKIKEMELAEVNNTPDCFKIVFGDLTGKDFLGDEVSSGTTHEHVEWNPSDREPEKQQAAADRVAYIAGRVAPKEQVQAVEANNWKDYVLAMIQLMRQHQAKQKQLYMKAMGNVYNGNARVKFPGYRAFLASEPNELSWSAKEKESNREYLNALNSNPSSPEDAETLDNIDEASF